MANSVLSSPAQHCIRDTYLDVRLQASVIHHWDLRYLGTGQVTIDANGIIAILPAAEVWYELFFRPSEHIVQPVEYQLIVGEATLIACLQHDVKVAR